MTTTKGYILIEVIISIMILSMVSLAIYKISSNEKQLIFMAHKRLKSIRVMSIPLNRHSVYLDKRDLNLYDLIKDDYNLKNDFLIKELKNKKVKYIENYKSDIKISSNQNILIDEIILKFNKITEKFITLRE